jgi:hypothetical protein
MVATQSDLKTWLVFLATVIPTLGIIAAAYFAARPAYLASTAEKDVKIVASFTEVMGRAQARSDTRVLGRAEQQAAIVVVAEMGTNYPDLLLDAALAGLEDIDASYPEEDKKAMTALPAALAKLREAKQSRG